MAQWTHTYRPGEIGPQGTISGTQPGRLIALAVTEIQEKAITDIALELSGGLEGGIEFDGNSATISLDASAPSDSLPSGGQQYQVLQRDGSGNAVWDWVRAVSP